MHWFVVITEGSKNDNNESDSAAVLEYGSQLDSRLILQLPLSQTSSVLACLSLTKLHRPWLGLPPSVSVLPPSLDFKVLTLMKCSKD